MRKLVAAIGFLSVMQFVSGFAAASTDTEPPRGRVVQAQPCNCSEPFHYGFGDGQRFGSGYGWGVGHGFGTGYGFGVGFGFNGGSAGGYSAGYRHRSQHFSEYHYIR